MVQVNVMCDYSNSSVKKVAWKLFREFSRTNNLS